MAEVLLPRGWRQPTPAVITQYVYGIWHGLVPPAHRALSQPAELVPYDEITRPQAQRVLDRMYDVIQAVQAADYSIAGLAAPQIGEASQIILVPRHKDVVDTTYGDFMPVFNPALEINTDVPREVVPHGCFSSNEVFARLPSASELILTGFDVHGEPLRLLREGTDAVVDEHECWHLAGIRAADIAMRDLVQLDWRPPEDKQEYRAYFAAAQTDSAAAQWHKPYPYDQWEAVRNGGFTIEAFLS